MNKFMNKESQGMHLFWTISRQKSKLTFSSLETFQRLFSRILLHRFKSIVFFGVVAVVTAALVNYS